jgi:hypothetical protein
LQETGLAVKRLQMRHHRVTFDRLLQLLVPPDGDD